MYPCLIIPILVGLISAFLGYLLGKSSSSDTDSSRDLQLELDNCRAKSFKLSADLEALKAKGAGFDTTNRFVSETVTTSVPFDANLSSSVFGKKIKENDLKIIEGIGPKIEELFNASGISTWKELSETSVERCNEILDSAGERFVIHNPTTWPNQAKLAYEGKWKELKDWQETLDGGKE
jgi:predicted flap endonuclease-1-like 5' DNA nuclease